MTLEEVLELAAKECDKLLKTLPREEKELATLTGSMRIACIQLALSIRSIDPKPRSLISET